MSQDPQTSKLSWRDAFVTYRKPKVIAMTFLGFSAGLPYLLVYVTLSTWLRDAGLDIKTVGFFAWASVAYGIKVLWSPIIDHLRLPFLTKHLGKRRSWMLLAQLCIALGLYVMATLTPMQNLSVFACAAVWVAFWSATQDIALDAYRIEALEKRFQGAMAATYVFGYRASLIVAGAGALYIAEYYSWTTAYITMALLMSVGIITTLLISEPENLKLTQPPKKGVAWLHHVLVEPFTDFFKRYGLHAVLILLVIVTFRVSDITMGFMAQPFYLDLGFSKKEIADISKIYGVIMTIVGGFAGGLAVVRYGVLRPMLIAAILTAATNLMFIYLESQGHSINSLLLVISFDNTSNGFAMSVFVAFLSGLTHKSFTATQYALFSSLMNLPAKLLSGFSGTWVNALGYSGFFATTALLGLPAILLIICLLKRPDVAGLTTTPSPQKRLDTK